MNQDGDAGWQILPTGQPKCIHNPRTCAFHDLPELHLIEDGIFGVYNGGFGGFRRFGGFEGFDEFEGFGDSGEFDDSDGFGNSDEGFGEFGGFGGFEGFGDSHLDSNWECIDASGNLLENGETLLIGSQCKLRCEHGYEDSLCELQFELK